MSAPSPKRRKISPTTASSVDSSPTRHVRRTSVRASFMSPTKASLARFNPSLLPRPTAAGGGSKKDQQATAGASSTGADPIQKTVDQQLAQELAQASPGDRTTNQFRTTQRAFAPEEEHDGASSPLQPRDPQPEKDKQPEPSNPNGELPTTMDTMRGTVTSQTQPSQAVEDGAAAIAKAQEKERLLQELRDLEDEVKRYEHHIEKSQRPLADSPTGDDNVSNLISLITAHNHTQQAQPLEPPPISQLLTSFLPFAKPRPVALPTPPPQSPEEDIPSHRPITLDDPLPYLRLFTPFTITSTIDPPTPSNTANALEQLHAITMHSPSALLTAKLDLIISNPPPPTTEAASGAPVHQTSPIIADLKIQHLSPWAAREIGPWLHERASKRDVGAVCWALGTYWDLSVKRAECWMKCEKAFPHLLGLEGEAAVAGDGKATAKKPAEGRRNGRGGRGSQDTEERDGEEEEEVSGIELEALADPKHSASGGIAGFSRKDSFRQLGRSVLVFESREVVLRVKWHIRFDWTGEAESVLSADAAFPGVWHEADERSSLKKVSETFDRLIRSRGVFGGVKIMVRLLFEK